MQMSSKPHSTNLGLIGFPALSKPDKHIGSFDRFHEQDEFSPRTEDDE